MIEYKCKQCGQPKITDDYYWHKNYRQPICKKCQLFNISEKSRKNANKNEILPISEYVDGVLITEEWLPIKNYEGLYEISSFGRIKTLSRRFVTVDKLMKLQDSAYGYYIATLNKGNKNTKTWLVHILVATHFIPNPENKPEVNHKKGIKKDNRFFELEWTTKLENVRHAIDIGLFNHKGVKNANHILNEKDVVEIFNSDEDSLYLSNKYKVKKAVITQIKRGERWGHLTGKKFEKRKSVSEDLAKRIIASKLSNLEKSIKFNLPYHIITQLKNRKQLRHLF